jgi:hypothetical protein
MKKLFFFLSFLLVTGRSSATTWDEPWADQVIKEASSFVLARIITSDPEKGITIQPIKTLGGTELKNRITINGFSHLHLCSNSGHGPEYHTGSIDSCYFFIRQDKEGKYCIPTPTTGFDHLSKGQVAATYRHSYHQASVPVEVYEKTMTALFNHYHGQPYDKEYIKGFVKEHLQKKPAGFEEGEIGTFFLQHVALECTHHLRLEVEEQLLIPFLNDKGNFHNQISAARALVAYNTNNSRQALLKIISDTAQPAFVQVMCVWTLMEWMPEELKPQLQELAKTASDESGGFGGNMMDPRVCTHLPSLKRALEEFVGKF